MSSFGSRPVPQNIMNVEFKLFELITLKQFFLSFGLFFFCILLFYLGQGIFWKLILPILIAMVGFIFIYVPFNGEPFSNFISYYMEAMISPQRRIWNKKGVVVKSAYKAAKEMRFGNDPKDTDDNDFKFKVGNGVTFETETVLDLEESEFITSKEINANIGTDNHIKNMNLSHDDNTTQPLFQKRVDLNQFDNNDRDSSTEKGEDNQFDINTNFQTYTNQQSKYLQKEDGTRVDINFSTNNSPTSVQNESDMPSFMKQDIKQNVDSKSDKTLSGDGDIDKHMVDEDEFEKAIIDDAEGFIFGVVEQNDEPVSSAAVVLKKDNKNLEIVYTNSNGEFKSNFEHKAGVYTVVVNHNSKEIIRKDVDFDPYSSDRIELILSEFPDAKQKQEVSSFNTQKQDILSNNQSSGVFTGEYNPSFPKQNFYNGSSQNQSNMPPVQIPSDQNNLHQAYPTANQVQSASDNQQHFQQSNMHVPNSFHQNAQRGNNVNLDLSSGASNVVVHPVSQNNTNLVTSLPFYSNMPFHSNLDQAQQSQSISNNSFTNPSVPNNSLYQGHQSTYKAGHLPQNPVQNNIHKHTVPQSFQNNPPLSGYDQQNVYQTKQNDQNTTQNNLPQNYFSHQLGGFSNQTNQQGFKEYTELPATDISLDQNLIYIPNSLNGRVVTVNQDGTFLGKANVVINIKSEQGAMIRTLATDNFGAFYSYAPLANGRFYLEIKYGELILRIFVVTLTGDVINPRNIII